MPIVESDFDAAAKLIGSADALLIGCGAGMGVDSGLPDFRGPEGFWKAYPVFRGKSFAEMSTPHWFKTDPALAWGFFGHRLHLYRTTEPHAGFVILKKWAERLSSNYFVFTSNVDGQFHKAGFESDRVLEQHGSIHYLQCVDGCGRAIWAAEDLQIDVDLQTMRARGELPECPDCGGIARPNILMFSDWQWDDARHSRQFSRYQRWLSLNRGRRIIAVEVGAGLAIPTVRSECERLAAAVIRINPRDCDAPRAGIVLALGAKAALTAIDQRMAP